MCQGLSDSSNRNQEIIIKEEHHNDVLLYIYEIPTHSNSGGSVMENQNEINVLDELNKGACMGMDAIHFIMDKVEEGGLKEELNRQYTKYKEISTKIYALYPEYSRQEPHETSTMNKLMTWYGIEMKTLTDSSTSRLTELLLQGTNMGIIEGRKLLNHKDTNEDVHKLVKEYVDMQEDAVEKLKQFL